MLKRGELRRLNILEGSVSSGKTWISLVLWALWVACGPEDAGYIMVAKTITSLRRNVLMLLESLVGARNFTVSLTQKEARLFGRLVFLEGASDARAENKIRGMTLRGAYCDEITLFSEDFFNMLLSRLRVEGAKLIGTTNPDNPNHWLMENYLKRADKLDLLTVNFTIDDNTFLPREYVKNLKKEFSGMFYERFILGKWVLADGLVYGMFKPEYVSEEVPRILEYYVGIDYGQSNATVFLLAGLGEDERLYIIDEYYHNGKKEQSPKSPYAYANDFIEWVRGNDVSRLGCIYYDPSALGFRAQLAELGVGGLKAANNDVLCGIQIISAMFDKGLIRISPRCKHFVDEIYGYAWDTKSAKVGKDKPCKENDHVMDAFRYLVMGKFSYWKNRLGS